MPDSRWRRNRTHALFADPHHPYTAALLAALPERATGRRLPAIPGVVPGQFDRPAGCLFSPRCAFATDLCRTVPPPNAAPELGRALCHYPLVRGQPTNRDASSMSIVLEGRDLTRDYSARRGMFSPPATVKALAGVSFDLETGKTLAVVGESGSGKSTLARLVTMIEEPTRGTLKIDGVDLATATAEDRRKLRRHVQIVFQNPYGSLNPRQTIGAALEEPLLVNTDMPAVDRRKAARDMMARVGLRPEFVDRYPHMFSGGQRQRIAIARALMLRPKILVLDEPVSALDVSIRAQVLNLLAEIQQEFGLAYLFIIARSLGRAAHRGPGHGHLSRPCGGGGARAKRSSRRRSIPIPVRCYRRRPWPIRRRRRSASCSRASCPRPSIRRADARSIRAVRWHSNHAPSGIRRWR